VKRTYDLIVVSPFFISIGCLEQQGAYAQMWALQQQEEI
jgi:hypothetical protein